MANVFKSIWGHKKVKAAQRKLHELDREREHASRQLERAKDEALRDHKKKHHKKKRSVHRGHRRYY